MSRFNKLSHVLWHCQYHIVWVPKYRYRILKDQVGFEITKSIRVHAERLGCVVVELNVQPDHVHLLVKVPPKVVSIPMAEEKPTEQRLDYQARIAQPDKAGKFGCTRINWIW